MIEAEARDENQSRKLVPAEGNFEEHPYFRVGDRNAGTGIMHYKNELRTNDGKVLKQTWTVRGVHGRGLPGRYDQDVYVALLQLIDKKGLPEDGWVSFSIYELVELMNKKHSGREYQQVRESLIKLAATSIESYNAFYNRGTKSYVTDTFSLLTEVKLSEYEDIEGERRDRNRVHLSQYFVDSYKANYLKSIDVSFYWSLSSPIAKRLYRLIDKKRNGRRNWEAELFSLKERIPLSDYKYASKIKEKLRPAHDELREKGFLEKVDYRRTDESEFAVYEITESFRARRAAVLEQMNNDQIYCVQRLVAEGMARDTAEELVSSFGSGRVMHFVEALPYQKKVRNPAGWLKRAIQNNFELDMPPVSSAAKPSETRGKHDSIIDADDDLKSLDQDSLFAESHGEIHQQRTSAPLRPEPDPEAASVWEPTLEAAAEELSSPALAVWFEGTIPVGLAGSHLTLSAPNDHAREYIEARFIETLKGHLRPLVGEDASIEILSH